jgi:asparagine synthase (glutamine-hydrolysing)
MCGIAGYTGARRDNKIEKMLAAMVHRGYDDESQYSFHNVHIGMNRLAINDLTKNIYPIHFKHYTLIFNGEIYNYKELKKFLEVKGTSFLTRCDAEVILPMFDIYGVKSFSKFEGMFAMCILDKKSGMLYLVRDKFGEKPLYYTYSDKQLSFSSEIKALLVSGETRNTLNVPALGEYFIQGFVERGSTLIRGINKVQPSNYLKYDLASGTKEIAPYWHLRPSIIKVDLAEDEAVSNVESLIKSSVQRRSFSNAPLGVFLSGGIDSSLIAYYASLSTKRLKSFSVTFPDFEYYDESRFSLKVAKWLSTDHQEISCTVNRVREIIPHLGENIDEPVVDPAFLPTYLMAYEARKKVKVALTGEGADEIFLGYDRYITNYFIQKYYSNVPFYTLAKRLSATLFPGRFKRFFPSQEFPFTAQQIWSPTELSEIMLPRYFEKLSYPTTPHSVGNILQTLQLADIGGYLACQLLLKVDRATMASNLESRAPYLDSNLANYVLGLPDKYKFQRSGSKYILRKVAELHFPKWFAWRRKHSFSVPLRDWLNRGLEKQVDEMLVGLRDYSSLFNIPVCTDMVDLHRQRSSDNAAKIWSLLVLTSWMSRYDIDL